MTVTKLQDALTRTWVRPLASVARKGIWAVLDQGIFAGSNFVQNVALARLLSTHEYGVYSVLHTTLLFFGVLHGGMLVEPMMVFGAGRFKDDLPGYRGALLRGHLLFSGLVGGLLVATAVILRFTGASDLAEGMLVLAAAQGSILFVWLFRRACYVKAQVFHASIGSLLYALVLLTGVAVGVRSGLLSAASAFITMGVAGLVAGAWQFWVVGRKWGTADDRRLRQVVRAEHLRYGGWAAAAGVASWFPENAGQFILPAVSSLEAGAALRALTNLAVPINHVHTALAPTLLPALVRARREARFARVQRLGLVLWVGSALLYGIALSLAGRFVIGLVYGGKYVEYAPLLWLVTARFVLSAGCSVLNNSLRALEKPSLVFASSIVGGCVYLVVGVVLAARWGVLGSSISTLCALAASGAALILSLLRQGRSDPGCGKGQRGWT